MVSSYDGSRLVLEQWGKITREHDYKMPVLFRTDKGHETELLKMLTKLVGGKMYRGRSVHNVRVERLWREVGSCGKDVGGGGG